MKKTVITVLVSLAACLVARLAIAWNPPTLAHVYIDEPDGTPDSPFISFPDPSVRGADGPDSDELPNVFDRNPDLRAGRTLQRVFDVANPLNVNSPSMDTARSSRASQIPQAQQYGSDSVEGVTGQTTATDTAKQNAHTTGDTFGHGILPSVIATARAIPKEFGSGFLEGFTGELPAWLGGTSDPSTMTSGRDGTDPINHGTGDFQIERVDLTLSGVGIPFELVRYYRSRWSYEGPLGANWMHSYDQALLFSFTDCGETVITWQTGAAALIQFRKNSFGVFEAKPASPYRLAVDTGRYFVESPDGIRRYFDSDGLLAEIRDLNGNHLTFTWSRTRVGEALTAVRLLSAVDTLSRTINFLYGPDAKLDAVEVPSLGQRVDYDIDARGDLVSATNAGRIVERYVYDFGHTTQQTVVPTAAIEPFCESACGLSNDSCGGPCVDFADDQEVSCMMSCYAPDTCDERCDTACADVCVPATQGTACLGDCQNLCTRGCYWNPSACQNYTSGISALQTPEMLACLKDHLDANNYQPCMSLAPGYQVQISNYYGCLRNQAWVCNSPLSVSDQYATDSCYNHGKQVCAVQSQGNLPMCENQAHCEDLCTDICRDGMICQEYTSNVSFIADPSDSLYSLAIQLGLNWFINSRGEGPYAFDYWTNRGCTGWQSCEGGSPTIAVCVVSTGPDYWDYRYETPNGLPVMCTLNECLDCCFNGENCPQESAQRGTSCQQNCRDGWRGECERDIVASCNDNCTHACPEACAAPCKSTCSTECTRECRTHAPCHELCGSVDFLGECQSGCFDRCVQENTALNVKGLPTAVYGNEVDLNHNLLQVIDGEGRTYITNTYEADFHVASYDQVTTQVFGGDTIRISSYDLKNTTAFVADEDRPLLATLPTALELCPLFCTSFESPGVVGERWVEVDPGEFLVFPEFASDPASGLPFGGDPSLDGFSWYELTRDGPGLSINPPIKLPSTGLTIETRAGALFLRSSDTYRGAITYSGIDAATADALFGSGHTLSLVHTLAGWRAFPGSAALLVRGRGPGRCAAEFGVSYSFGALKTSPQDACSGQLSFVEEGRRPGSAHRGLLSAPKQNLGYLFGAGVAQPIFHGERSDSFGNDLTWGRSCIAPGLIDPTPECSGARTTQASLGGPPGFDCGVPWNKRGAPTSPGIAPDPHPSSPDLTMECGTPVGIPEPPRPRCAEWSFAAGAAHEQPWAQPYSRVSIVRNVGAMGSSDVVWLYYADDSGHILTVRNVTAGSREDFAYDLEGRIAGTQSWFGNRRCMVHDLGWNLVQSVDLPKPEKWSPIERIDRRVHFGAHARPETIFDPNVPGAVLRSYAWDANRGNLLAIHFPDPHDDVSFTPDSRGRSDVVSLPNSLTVDYDYDLSNGLVSRITETSVSSAETYVRELLHDANGNLTHEEGTARSTADYQFSADGRMLSKTVTVDPTGGSLPLTTTYFYNDAGEIETELGPELDRYYVFTTRGLLARIDEDPHGPTTARTQCMRYDARGLLVEQVDGEGRRAYFDRDAMGNVFYLRRGIPTSPSPLAWDDGCPVRDGASSGEQLFEEILYDRGLPTTINRGIPNAPLTPLWATYVDYDGYGRPFETRIANGTTTRTALDARDQPMFSATYRAAPSNYPPGYFGWTPDTSDVNLVSLETYAFDHQGRTTGKRTRAFVDETSGRRLLTADGWVSSSYVYDASIGRVVSTDPAGQVVEGRVDAFGRPLQLNFHDAQSTVVDYSYADHGRTVTQRVTPSSNEGGRLVRVSFFTDAGLLSSEQIGAGVAQIFDYDDFGRPTYSDNRLERRVYRWNAFSELIGVDRVLVGGTTEGYLNYARNNLGVAKTISDAVSGSITHSFDFANRLAREEYADHSYLQHEYWIGTSAEKTRRDRVGNTVTTTYDDFGLPARIEGTNTAGGYAGPATSVISFTNGPLGVTSATAENKPGDAGDDVTSSYVLDSLGRVTQETSTLFPNEPVQRTLDRLGRASDTIIAANTVHHDFDPFDRLTGVRLNNSSLASLAYNGQGAPTQITFGNNLVETHTYDDEGRPRTATIPQKFGAELYYSDHGVLVRHDRWIGAGARTSRVFRHDALGRLQDAWTKSGLPTTGFTSGQITDSQLTGWTTGATRNESYTLNAADSWTTATYGTTNLPITLGTVDQRYLTFNGTVGTDADARTTALPDGRQYSYDALDRALGARTAQNQTWQFRYDAFGRLVAWTAAGTTTKLQYAGSFIREVSGTTETLHVLGSDGAPLAISRGSTKYFDHQSYGGRIDYATNSSGNIAERYNFSAYGRLTFANASGQTITTSAIGNRFLLNGQPYFTELAAYRLGHRFYLPEHGRFTSPDALGFVDGPNMLAYAGAQPIAYADPTGFDKADASVAHGIGKGQGRWLGGHAVSWGRDTLTTLGGPLVGGAAKVYNAWALGHQVEATYEKDGVNGAVNLFNPANGALINGYETQVAFEEGDVAGTVYHGLNTGEKVIDTVMMATAIFGAGKGGVEFLREQGASPKFVHDQYLEHVRPGAKEKSFDTSWTSDSGLGTRKYDDFAVIDGVRTGFEANTTPWAHVSSDKFCAKINQIGADIDLLGGPNPQVDRVIWFGTEPFPTSGLGAQIGSALREAGIEYWVVPWVAGSK